MKFTATATALAIATFFGAAPITTGSKSSKSDMSYSGKSGKGGKSGGKSSKSDCTFCSAETLTRAQLLTDLTFNLFAGEDGILNSTEIIDAVDEDEFEAFLSTVDNIAGCLIYPQCFVQGLLDQAANSTDFSETDFLMTAINTLCEAERLDERLPEGGCVTFAPTISSAPSSSSAPSTSSAPSNNDDAV